MNQEAREYGRQHGLARKVHVEGMGEASQN
jgi:hypothetical protein